MMSITGDTNKPQIIADTQQQDDSYEEPSINPPVMKKKKGITINEMLQNDLETDEEKLLRHQKAQEEDKQRIFELIKKKNLESDLSIAQSDEDEILRMNYLVKGSERDSNDFNNLSYNQEVMSGNPYQNDLAMLDQSYTGPNEGGFNGYSSMKKSENNNLMNDSRPSSSPRNNNLMRTYDSLAMTQQFNYGFNYNTSGGGNEILSQNSALAKSIVEKVVNEGSDRGDENMQYQSQKSFDLEVFQEQREGDPAIIYANQQEKKQDQSDIEEHKQIQSPIHDVQDRTQELSESNEGQHTKQKELVENEEELKVQQIIDEQILTQHENDPQENNQTIHSKVSDIYDDNIETEQNKIQLEELKEQLQVDTDIVNHGVFPDQQKFQELPLKQEFILEEPEIVQISDYQKANIKIEESSSEVIEDSQESKSNEFQQLDKSLGLKENHLEIKLNNHQDGQLQDEQILSQNHRLQASLSNQHLDNVMLETYQRQEQQHSKQEINQYDDGELKEQQSTSNISQEELKHEVQHENIDGMNSEISEPTIQTEELLSKDHKNDIEEIAQDQGKSEDHKENKLEQEDLQEPEPTEEEKTLDQHFELPTDQEQPAHQPLNDQVKESSDDQKSNNSPKSASNQLALAENEDESQKDQAYDEIQQILIQDRQQNDELIYQEEDKQQIDEQQELSQPQSSSSLQQSPRSHESKQSVKNKDDKISIQSKGEEQKDLKEPGSNNSSKKSIDLNEHEEDPIEVNSEEEAKQQEQVPEQTEIQDTKSEGSEENQNQANGKSENEDQQESQLQPYQVQDQEHLNSKSQTPQSRNSQKISQNSEKSNEAQSEQQQEFSEEEEEQKIIEVSSQKSKNDQSNEDGFFQPAQDQKISAVDFDDEADLGNSFSQPNSFQQSSDTIKHMFDALDNNNFKYKSMSKRNLQIEIPETEYSGDENATVNQEEAKQPDGSQQQVEYEEKEPLEYHQVELPQEGEEEGQDVQSEHSQYVEESSAEQEEVQEHKQSDEDDQQTGSEKQQDPNQSEEEEEEESIDGEELEKQESPQASDKQIPTPKESSQSEQSKEEVHIDEPQIQQNNDQSENDHETEVISQTEGPQEQDQIEVQRIINNSFEAKSRSQNESIQSIEKQESLQKSNLSVSQKQLSRKSSERIASAKEPSQNSYKQASQQEEEEGIPQIEQPQFEEIVSSKHSSNNSFKKNLENQYEHSERSPLNQLESLHELKDYSIEDYVAEQKDIEMRHKQLNNDMYNLLSHDLITTNNNDEYKSPKNNIESLSSISERNVGDEQFFYRDGTANDSETHRDNMMIIGDDMSSNGGNNFRQQQQQDNEDRYGNIGKWELERKENEINEIESLDFSVKREEFPDQHYQSNVQSQPEDLVKVPEEPLKGEQMPIYNSPDKNVEEINLFNHKRDSKTSVNIAPRPPSTENRPKSIVAKPIKKQQVQEKRGIQKIKDLFNSEEKYQLYERLHSKETLSSQRKKRAFDQDDSAKKGSQLTFRPNINTKSNILSTSQLDETKLTQRAIDPCIFLYHKGVQLRKEKQEQLAAQQKIKEDEEEKKCTFRPNIGQINLERAVPKSMYQRNLYWDEQRKKKIREEQEKIKDSELDGCTFTPQIQAHSLQQLRSARQDDDYQYESMPIKSQRSSRSRNAKNMTQLQSLASERSVKVFIERQERAKQQKLQKDAVFKKNNGSNWKNEVTKPRPPKITDIIISNLQKKLSSKFVPQGDISKQQYSSRRKSKDLQLPRNMTQQHSREGSTIEGVDQDIMIFDDADNLSTFKKPKQSNAEFKEQVKFLRQALHSLDLDQ